MKKEILMLIIGILIGAIIATGVFLVLKGNMNNEVPGDMGRGNFQKDGEMPSTDGTGRGNMKQDENTTTDTTNSSET